MVRKIIKKLIKDKKKSSPKKTTPKNTAPKRRGRPPKSATQKPKATGVTKKQSPKATGVTKKAPAKKPSAKAKPVPVKTPTTGQKAAAAGIVGGTLAAGFAGKKKDMDKMSFNEAFKTARAKLGTDKTFTWRGKKYSTVTMDEVKKAGFNTLAEYNRSKQSKGGKATGQKGSQAKKKPSKSSDFRRKGSM